MNALSRNTESTSLHTKLLLSAAASALLFSFAPAQAACSFDAASNTIACTAGAGSATDPGVAAANLTPSLTMNVASKAALDGNPFFFSPGGTSPGAFTLTVAQSSGDITTIAGPIFASGVDTVSGNTATADNFGALTGGLHFSQFGGLMTVTNEAGGSISALDMRGAGGKKIVNAGQINNIYVDEDYSDEVKGPTHTHTGTYSTDTTTSTHKTLPTDTVLTNTGKVLTGVSLWGADLTVDNSGTITGGLSAVALNGWGADRTTTVTEVYLDTPDIGFPQFTHGGYPDDNKVTTVSVSTAYGGKATVTNSGTVASIAMSALDALKLADSGLVIGNVSLQTTDAEVGNSTEVLLWTNDGKTQAHSVTQATTFVPDGGAITATVTKSGEIDGSFTAAGTGGASLDTAGLIKGEITVDAHQQSTSFTSSKTNSNTLWHKIDAPAAVVDPATPPNTITNTDNEIWVDNGSDSNSTTQVVTSVGGKGSLVNQSSGIIGASATPVNVTVAGDVSAAIENDGTIYANAVSITAQPYTSTTTDSSSNSYVDPSYKYDDRTLVAKTVQTDDGTNPVYVSYLSSVLTENQSSVSDHGYSNVQTYGSGAASLVNTGAINGAVSVQGSGKASVDNSGTIAGSITLGGDGKLTNTDISNSSENGNKNISNYDTENTAGYQSAVLVGHDSYVQTFDYENWSSNKNSQEQDTVGFVTSLTNEKSGVLGAKGSPVDVLVNGQASASFENDGTAYVGALQIKAQESKQIIKNNSSNDYTDHHVISSATTVQGGVVVETVTGDLSHEIQNTTSDNTNSVAYTGGTASLINTSSKSIQGSVGQVRGVKSATLDNSGTITGSVNVYANINDHAFSGGNSNAFDNLSDNTVDTLFADDGKGLLTTTTTTTNTINDKSSNASNNSMEFVSSGGDALLTNETTGVIGVSADPPVFVSVNVQGGTSAGLANGGTIYGYVNLGAATTSQSNGSSSSNTATNADKSIEVTVELHDTTIPAPNDYIASDNISDKGNLASSSSSKSWSSWTATGGEASLTNAASALITGSVNISGLGGASADNAGTLAGAVTVNSNTLNSSSLGSNESTVSRDWVTEDDFTRALDKGVLSTTGHYTSTVNGTDTTSNANSSSQDPFGGDASFVNEAGAVVGDAKAYVNVSVNGVGSAQLNNGGTIYGSAQIASSSAASANSYSQNTGSTSTNTWDRTQSDDYTYATKSDVPVSYDLKETETDKQHTVTVRANSNGLVGGAASYTGSGNLYGSLQVTAVGAASLNNTGWIGDLMGGGTVRVASSGTDYIYNQTETYDRTSGYTNETVDDYKTKVRTATGSRQSTTSDEFVTTYSYTPTGGAASLSNSGTIGGDSLNPISVSINGDAGAALSNTGHINGAVDVFAGTGTTTSNEDRLTTTVDVLSGTQTTGLPLAPVPVWLEVSTDTKTTDISNVKNDSFTPNAALATASNSSSKTITGGLTVSGNGGATVVNTGAIWGDVTMNSTPSQASTTSNTLTSSDVMVTALDQVKNTKLITDTYSSTRDHVWKYVSAGGDVVLNNSGTIGNRVSDTKGHTWIYDADFDSSPDGGVYAYANGNISLTNAKGGVIYNQVLARTSGYTNSAEIVTTDNSTTITASDASGTKNVVTTYHDHETYKEDQSWTATGGTATLTNAGSIGQNFADTAAAGGGTTGAYGVNLNGQAGASIVNAGLIGGGAQAFSNASNEVYSDTWAATTDQFSSYKNKGAGNTRTYTTSDASSDANTAAGGTASISNSASGQIGVDILDGYGSKVGVNALVVADGDAGASISNDGLIQASEVFANSHAFNSVFTTTDTQTQTNSGAAMDFVSSSETYVNTRNQNAVGGTATIKNTGSILSDVPVAVTASGFGGATITNSKTGLIDNIGGLVDAESWGTSRVITSSTASSYNTLVPGVKALVSETDVNAETDTLGGNAALVDNLGKITGGVRSSGFVSGTVTNEAGASIGGSVSARSSARNYTLSATVTYLGPSMTSPPPGTPGADSYAETYTWVGGNALIDNYGKIGGSAYADAFTNAAVTNEAVATVAGRVEASSFYKNSKNDDPTGTGAGGTVTLTAVGGTAAIANYGTVNEGFDIHSYNGSTFTNAAAAAVDTSGTWNFMYTYDVLKSQNSFANAGTIGAVPSVFTNLTTLFGGLTGYGSDLPNIEFQGNTTASNTGVIVEDLLFTSSDSPDGISKASFTFKQGSILTGNINAPADVANATGPSLAQLTVNFENSGLYQGNIYGVSATNKTGAGTWILTGNSLGLGNTTISGGMVELGTPLNYFLVNPQALAALLLPAQWDPLQGMNPWSGNTAVMPALQGQPVSSSMVNAMPGAPIVTGDITIASGGVLEGRAILLGNMANSGTLLAGWMLPSDASLPLGNLLDNTNRVLASNMEISGNYTQAAGGTLVANIAPTINRPERQLVGKQAGLFAPTEYWLSVAPFAPDATKSAYVTVDGKTTIAGKVMVYVNKGGLYVNGTSTDILTSSGALTVTATTSQSAPSPFVGFNLSTRSSGGKNILSVVVNRTSYASVATNANAANVGHALDTAVPTVAAAISANNFPNVEALTDAQDMAGFLSDLDWQAGGASQAAAIFTGLSPDAYATLPAIDTGAGFRAQVMRHLTTMPGGAIANPVTGAWMQGYGVSQNVKANHGAGKLDGSTVGTSLGWDFSLDNIVVGVAGGYSRTTVDTPDKSFRGAINAYQAGAYARGQWMDALYIDATLWADFGNGHVNRALLVGNRVASAPVKPSEFRADVDGGWRFSSGSIGITPYVGISVRDAQLDDITETGAGGLGYRLSDIGDTLFTPTIGVRFDDTWTATSFVTVQPLIGLGVELQPKAKDITAQFIGGGDAFTVNSAARSSAAFKPEAGLNILIGQNVSMQLGYTGAFGSDRSTQGGWIGLRGNW